VDPKLFITQKLGWKKILFDLDTLGLGDCTVGDRESDFPSLAGRSAWVLIVDFDACVLLPGVGFFDTDGFNSYLSNTALDLDYPV
jgi:hypothetical protein